MFVRTRSGIRLFVIAAVVFAAAAVGVTVTRTVPVSAADEKPWVGLGGDASNSRYYETKQITKTNVDKLQVAWTYPYGETGFGAIVAHGVIYGRGRGTALVALDAKTGKEIWVRDGMTGITRRGINYWESADGSDRRLIFAFQDLLQELDAKTGKPVMSFGTNGVTDLREGLGRDPATIGGIQSGTPGEVFENLIILGSATGEGYLSPPGDLRAFNVLTGKQEWIFHTVPHPGEFGYETWPKEAYKYIGGTNTWGEMSVDTKRGIVYFPTGSPTYDYYGADRIGQDLFANCLIALDARTGKRLWHFQAVHHDLWDFDNNAAPQLTTITRNGQKVDVVAMAGKTGFLYVFNRVTGDPIWPIEERAVPKSTMPGEQSWPTQPFPTNPPPFAKQTALSIQDLNTYDVRGNSPAQHQAMMDRLAAAKNNGIFTPIELRDTIHIPGNNGGALFGTTSADPNNGFVYVVSQDNPALIRLFEPGSQAARGGGAGGANLPGAAVYARECAVCHNDDRSGDTGPSLLDVTTRLSNAQITEILNNGRGRMPAFVHLTAQEQQQVIEFLGAPAAGGRGGAGGRGRGAGGAAVTYPPLAPGVLAGNGAVLPRPAARGAGGGRGGEAPYPEGSFVGQAPPRYSINGQYGTITSRMKPPYTQIYKYDLNKGEIVWHVGFGDDPQLAALGVHDTGTTQMRNSVLITSTGLVIGASRDGYMRAWDAETGKKLWSSPVGGNTIGQPSLYEVDGKTYLLMGVGPAPLAGTSDGAAGGRGAAGGGAGAGRGANPTAPPESTSALPKAPEGPKGYVAFALPSGSSAAKK